MNTVEIGEMKTLFVDFLSQNCNDGGLFSMRLRYRLQHIFAEHRGNEAGQSYDTFSEDLLGETKILGSDF